MLRVIVLRFVCSAVYNWTVDDVIEWLIDHVELPQYANSFRVHSVDGHVLPRYVIHSVIHLTSDVFLGSYLKQDVIELDRIYIMYIAVLVVPLHMLQGRNKVTEYHLIMVFQISTNFCSYNIFSISRLF